MRERHHHHHHYHDRHSYPFNAGHPGPGPNPHRLYRDKDRKVIAGVCAGIANYYGWRSPDALRFGWFFMALFFFPLPIVAYIVAAIVIKPGPSMPVHQTREEEEFWRTFSTRPRATFSELKHRFRALDARLASLESAVVSDEYRLRAEFRDLERGA